MSVTDSPAPGKEFPKPTIQANSASYTQWNNKSVRVQWLSLQRL